jgi:hypothetical protein
LLIFLDTGIRQQELTELTVGDVSHMQPIGGFQVTQAQNGNEPRVARNNPEKVRESAKYTHEKNLRERLAYMKYWQEANKEHFREYQRAHAERARGVTANDV